MALLAVAREIAPKKYHQMLQDVLSRGMEAQSKIELDDGAFTGLDYTDTPPGFTSTFHIEHYATRTEHTLRCPLPFTTPITLEDDAPRKTDAEISATYGKYITNISLELPEGFTVPNLPAASATSPWGSYRESATLQGNLLLVHWEVTQTVLRVPVSDTAQYGEFMFGMYQASQAPLTLVPVQATSTT